MPGAYYLETGAWFKRYQPERGSQLVNELFDGKQRDEVFLTSQFTLVETKAVASRMLKGRELRRRQYERLMARFYHDLGAYNVQVLPVESALLSDALALYPEHPLRAPDALHLVTALHVDRTFAPPSFYIVSGDKDITDAARAYGIGVIDPEDAGALAYLRGLR